VLFDFRHPDLKRREFNARRGQLLAQLLTQYGQACQLQLPERCNLASGIAVDHLIPLSSNKLNKELRELSALPGRKVPTQSLGSNHIANLIVACSNCNNYKKHRLLERQHIRRILVTKSFEF
jgi:5-methylcytosine-specific restriction endonuclease McrA